MKSEISLVFGPFQKLETRAFDFSRLRDLEV